MVFILTVTRHSKQETKLQVPRKESLGSLFAILQADCLIPLAWFTNDHFRVKIKQDKSLKTSALKNLCFNHYFPSRIEELVQNVSKQWTALLRAPLFFLILCPKQNVSCFYVVLIGSLQTCKIFTGTHGSRPSCQDVLDLPWMPRLFAHT